MIVLKDGRADLHQWDTGRILAVDPDINELHFAKNPMGRSLDVDATGGEARIPDVLLQTPGNLHIWAFVGTPEDGYTKVSKIIKIQSRNKPADYVFTPQEQTTLKQVMERLDRVPGDIEDALAEAKASGEFDGENGETPYIKDGYWWVGNQNTGVKAQGEQGIPGANGIAPHIGGNGNWFVGDTDTGVRAQGEPGQPGRPGSDANVTSENIKAALGYTPAKQSEIPSVPVQSVNGKVGDVKLEAADVGAATKEQVEQIRKAIAEQSTNFETFKSNIVNGDDYTLSECKNKIGTIHNGESLDTPSTSANTAFIPMYLSTNGGLVVKWDGSIYKILACYYNENKEFQRMGGWLTSGSYSVVPTTSGYPYVAVEIRRIDNAAFTAGELDTAIATLATPFRVPYLKVLEITEDLNAPLKITSNCVINGNGHTIDANGEYYALDIGQGLYVEVYNLNCTGSNLETCIVRERTSANFYECSFNGSTGGNGFQAIAGSATNCFNCTANGNANDGFNYHGSGKHSLVNCTANNNGGDGASNHDAGNYLYVDGGIYNNNAKAGLAVPTYGADGDVDGAWLEGNLYGLQIYNGENIDSVVTVRNCVIANNTGASLNGKGMQISGYKVKAANNILSGNDAKTEILHGATYTEYANQQ